MEITATIGGNRYAVDIGQPHDISIPVRFDGARLSAFGAAGASKKAYSTEGFIGDVGKGGSCNCDVFTFSPHLHGTHTECVGHISDKPIAVCEALKDSLMPATLVSITPQAARESYIPALKPTDSVITREALEKALAGNVAGFHTALVIRTMPNHADKIAHQYGNVPAPFFSIEAMEYLVQRKIEHLLVDIPSIDRLDDEGKLTNHHIFWGVKQGSHAVDDKNPSPKTVTELIYVPDTLADGQYMLNLQVASFVSDAAPSRPLLYMVKAV